jgi:hypothetical protein
LAKSDAIDARVIAHFAEVVRPPPRLKRTIAADPFPLSPRIRTLRTIVPE